jgi:endonuclease YncB( thermonuclease family)
MEKTAISDLCFGKQVSKIKSGEDRYGRILGFVMARDINVNKELLRQRLLGITNT